MTNNKSKSKNDNKTIICSFLGENKNINLPYEEAKTKFFAIEKNKIIRPDAFRFYHKGIKAGKFDTIPPSKITVEKVEVKKPAVASKPADKTPTKAEVKKAVAKTKVVKAAKI